MKADDTRRIVAVDVGGTFTDIVAVEGGRFITTKVPTDSDSSDRSVLEGARTVDAGRASSFHLASTAGLNAIITRTLPKVAFFTTVGHRDVLNRGNLWRPFEALTDSSWRRSYGDSSRPLVPRYLRRGIVERIAGDGQVLIPLDHEQAVRECERAKKCGVEGIAICLLHSWLDPTHEQLLLEIVRDIFGEHFPCSMSSDITGMAKEFRRSSTTVIDLLMKLKYSDYTDRLQSGLGELGFEGEFNYSDCSAMLMPSSYAMQLPSRLVVGGPAAGTAASAYFGSVIDEGQLLCVDIGGTSCDISIVVDGRPWVNDQFEIEWDLVVAALSTEVISIGAGGGSTVSIGKAGELLVGPDSAGAVPGPAAYGKGGTRPTITDAALLIGIIAPDKFLGGKIQLDESRALRAFLDLDSTLTLPERIRYTWLTGLNNIAEALSDICIRHGADPRDFSLMAYGAAGPMILPSLLDLVPVKCVIVPQEPGEFSALGLVSTDQVYTKTRTMYGLLAPDLSPKIHGLFEDMQADLQQHSGRDAEYAAFVRTFDARLLRQGWETPFIPVPDGQIGADEVEDMISRFHEEYEKRYGHKFKGRPVEGVTYRVQMVVPTDKVVYQPLPRRAGSELRSLSDLRLQHLYAEHVTAKVFGRDQLQSGDVVLGPAIIREDMSTTFIPPGREATVGSYGELRVV